MIYTPSPEKGHETLAGVVRGTLEIYLVYQTYIALKLKGCTHRKRVIQHRSFLKPNWQENLPMC